MADKQRTITMTGRPPIRITESAWPTVARATGDSYGGGDYCRHEQALGQGECDEYHIRVRQHADGRSLVYATISGATEWTGTESRSGGELVATDADLAAAIRRVGEDVGIPDALIRDAVADLPAEDLG